MVSNGLFLNIFLVTYEVVIIKLMSVSKQKLGNNIKSSQLPYFNGMIEGSRDFVFKLAKVV